jgi:hypothetical protein
MLALYAMGIMGWDRWGGFENYSENAVAYLL